jgi:L-lysine exporter family protein LysE/ArgO
MTISIALLNGLGLGAGLIIAIGAQNAFLLNRALKNQHQFAIALLCSLIDSALIGLGILGMGSLILSQPQLLAWVTWGGAAFLLVYGAQAFYAASKNNSINRDNSDSNYSLTRALLVTLSLSLLNPHVYLDTMVLLGGISTQFAPELRVWFGLGAIAASFIWFFSLAFGARWLMPVFQKPMSWRILDVLIGVVMWSIAARLIVHVTTV